MAENKGKYYVSAKEHGQKLVYSRDVSHIEIFNASDLGISFKISHL